VLARGLPAGAARGEPVEPQRRRGQVEEKTKVNKPKIRQKEEKQLLTETSVAYS
jgi:hypothetical protein